MSIKIFFLDFLKSQPLSAKFSLWRDICIYIIPPQSQSIAPRTAPPGPPCSPPGSDPQICTPPYQNLCFFLKSSHLPYRIYAFLVDTAGALLRPPASCQGQASKFAHLPIRIYAFFKICTPPFQNLCFFGRFSKSEHLSRNSPLCCGMYVYILPRNRAGALL